MNRYPNQRAIGRYHGAGIILKPWIVAGILLRLLGPILTNYFVLGQFLHFHHFSIFLKSDVIIQKWLQIHATSSSMSLHVIISSISSFMPCHHHLCLSFDFHWVHSCHHVLWLFLCHHWTPFDINDNHIPYFQHDGGGGDDDDNDDIYKLNE